MIRRRRTISEDFRRFSNRRSREESKRISEDRHPYRCQEHTSIDPFVETSSCIFPRKIRVFNITCVVYTHFFYKTHFYKNVEAEICPELEENFARSCKKDCNLQSLQDIWWHTIY